MPALYKYQQHVTQGPNGAALDFRNAIEEDAPRATYLGEIEGWRYVSVPDDAQMPEQPEEIQWQAVTITPELRERLKRTRPVSVAKDVVRQKIENEVGDVHDLVADSMRLCEFAIALSVRVSHEILTGQAMDPAIRESYATRVGAVKDAMDSGDLIMRSDIEDPTEMMVRLMQRYSHITQLVGDHYRPAVDDLLP
jgi:hypothetical protein